MGLIKISLFIIYTGLFLSCGDSPVKPEPVEDMDPIPSWCSPHARELLGAWGERFPSRNRHYESVVYIIEKDDPCFFAYSLVTTLDTIPNPIEVYRVQGDIVVTEATKMGDVINMTIESRRVYRSQFNIDSGEKIEVEDNILYEEGPVKIWGDRIIIWGRSLNKWH